MPKFTVKEYHEVCYQFEVEAETAEAAMDVADEMDMNQCSDESLIGCIQRLVFDEEGNEVYNHAD
jgi:hypothetical protein